MGRKCLFSTTCKTRSWRWSVEACGSVLKAGADDSYKIIYSWSVGPKPLGVNGEHQEAAVSKGIHLGNLAAGKEEA